MGGYIGLQSAIADDGGCGESLGRAGRAGLSAADISPTMHH